MVATSTSYKTNNIFPNTTLFFCIWFFRVVEGHISRHRWHIIVDGVNCSWFTTILSSRRSCFSTVLMFWLWLMMVTWSSSTSFPQLFESILKCLKQWINDLLLDFIVVVKFTSHPLPSFNKTQSYTPSSCSFWRSNILSNNSRKKS